MKKIILLLAICFTIIACKKDVSQETETISTDDVTNDGLTLVEGNFVYYADAAVLQTPTSIFGVILNEKTTELAEKAKAYQNEPTDMVKVRVRGFIEKKPEGTEGWDYNVNIKKIIALEALDAKENEVIKLEK